MNEIIDRYGRVQLIRRNGDLLLTSNDIPLILELTRQKELQPYIKAQEDEKTLRVELAPWLKSFLAGDRAIAVVPAEKVSEIQKLLSKRGMDIRE